MIIRRTAMIFCTLTLLFSSCNHAGNYKNASIIKVDNKYFIKLKGKRNLMVHDPISLIKGKTYEDSILIPLINLKTGIIKGDDVIFDEGTYKYTYNGSITIRPKYLKVNLFAYDTIANKRQISQFPWNGDYQLTNYQR